MAVKDTRGTTKWFSGLAQNVTKPASSQRMEEPRLTPEQVVAVFRSFGYEPNKNQMNDVGYWSTQPVSATSKLMGDLKKRRETDNASIKTLSDDQITSIFNEYGFAVPDLKWVRGNLPQEEKKMRSVLDIQRKSFNEELKGMLQQNKNQQAAPSVGQSPMMGMGGPGDMSLGNMPSTPQEPTDPFFIGDTALVRLTNQNNGGSPTLWLADNRNKTLRPIPETAIETLFEDPASAQASIVNMTTSDLAPGGILQGFKMLGSKYGVQPDGAMEEIDFSPSQIGRRYGKSVDEASEQRSVSILDGLLGTLSSSEGAPISQISSGVGGPYDGQGGPGDQNYSYGITPDLRDSAREQAASAQLRGTVGLAGTGGDIDPSFVIKLKSDPERMGFYLAALTYGGYTIGDIYNDMKRLELASRGNESAKTIRVISADQTRNQYVNTPEGSAAQSAINGLFPKPSVMSSIDPNLFNYTVYNLPPEAFKKLVPILDPRSEEYNQALDKVKTGMYDILLQQLQATTEQDKALADYNYDNFKKDIELQYGIQLSDNADEAWKQIESLSETFAGRGLFGSGMQREALDEYLRSARKKDSRAREQRLTEEERRQAAEVRTSGRPEDIQRIIEEDKAKGLPQTEWRATRWGLIPSSSVANTFSLGALKAKFPELSNEEITRLRDTMIDENGNYRSDIYRNYYKGIYETELSRKQFKEQEVTRQSLSDEERAYREFTSSPDFMFSGTTKKDETKIESKTGTGEIPVPVEPTKSAPAEYSQPQQQSFQSSSSDTQPDQKTLDALEKQVQQASASLSNILASASQSGLYKAPTVSNLAQAPASKPVQQYASPIGPTLPPKKTSVASAPVTPSFDLSSVRLPSTSNTPKSSGLIVSQTGSAQSAPKPSFASRLKNTISGWFK